MRRTTPIAIAMLAFAACDQPDAHAPTLVALHRDPLLSGIYQVEPVATSAFNVADISISADLVLVTTQQQIRAFPIASDGTLSPSFLVSERYDAELNNIVVRPFVVPTPWGHALIYFWWSLARPAAVRALFADGGLGPRIIDTTYEGGIQGSATALPDGGAAILYAAFGGIFMSPVDALDPVTVQPSFVVAPENLQENWAFDSNGLALVTWFGNSELEAARVSGTTSLDPGGFSVGPSLGFNQVASSGVGFRVAAQTATAVHIYDVKEDATVSASFDAYNFDAGSLHYELTPFSLTSATPPVLTVASGSGIRWVFDDGGAQLVVAEDAGTTPLWLAATDAGWVGAWLSARTGAQLARFDPSFNQMGPTVKIETPLEEAEPVVGFAQGVYLVEWVRTSPVSFPGFYEMRRLALGPVGNATAPLSDPAAQNRSKIIGRGDHFVVLDLFAVRSIDLSGDGGTLWVPDAGLGTGAIAGGPMGQVLTVAEGADPLCAYLVSEIDAGVVGPLCLNEKFVAQAAFDGERYGVVGSIYNALGGTDLGLSLVSPDAGVALDVVFLDAGMHTFQAVAMAGGAGQFAVAALDNGGPATSFLLAIDVDGGVSLSDLGGERARAIVWDGQQFVIVSAPFYPQLDLNEVPVQSSPITWRTYSHGVLSMSHPLTEGLAPTLAAGPNGQVLFAYAAFDPTPGIEQFRVQYQFMGPQPNGAGCGGDADCASGLCVFPVCVGPPDAGSPDAGIPDAGIPDAGIPDAGTPDGGIPDAGVPDAGSNPTTFNVQCGCHAGAVGLWPGLAWLLRRRRRV